jgi:hypothetical protein
MTISTADAFAINYTLFFHLCVENLITEHRILLLVGSSDEVMSTDVNTHSSATHLNDHYFQYLHPFDHHHQINIQNNNNRHRQMTTNLTNIFSNNLNEEENCQICGDLASGWHCG